VFAIMLIVFGLIVAGVNIARPREYVCDDGVRSGVSRTWLRSSKNIVLQYEDGTLQAFDIDKCK